MFKLPVCPHCKTVYSYKEVKNNNKKKTIICYHCKKEFKNSRAVFFVIGFIVSLAAVLINIFLLNTLSGNFVSIIPVIIVSIGAVLLGWILTPFFIKYKK